MKVTTCFILAILLTHLYFYNNVIAMGGIESMDEDKGVIGEKKTISGKQTYKGALGATYTSRTKGATFVTPVVTGDIAEFRFSFSYSFQFSCIGWRYWINEDRQLKKIASARVTSPIMLLSPEGNVKIETKVLDLPVGGELNTFLSQEQRDVTRTKAVGDPLIGEERTVAAQQSIRWVLDQGLSNYQLIGNNPAGFNVESIGGKKFIKTDVNVYDENKNIKKCNVWAINYWGYREPKNPEERRMLIWIALIITDPNDSLGSDILNRARMIFETLKFTKNQRAYPDLK